MPFIERVRSRLGFGRKEEPIINDGDRNLPTITVTPGFSYGVRTAWDYTHFARVGYASNSDVYACISLIAQSAKQIKWDMSQSSASMKLLEAAPGGSVGFLESWISYLLLAGNSYIEIGPGQSEGSVARVYLDQPDLVKATTIDYATGRPVVQVWQVRTSMVPREIPALNLVQSKLFNPLDPIYGMSPMQAAMMKVSAENEAIKMLQHSMERGFPSGWVQADPEADKSWNEEQRAALMRRIWAARTENADFFLSGATFNPIGFSPRESEATGAQQLSKRDIASVFHVPPELIGDSTTKTYSNVYEARQALYTEAVLPLVGQFKNDWNRTIGDRIGDYLEYDADTLNAIMGVRALNAERVRGLWNDGLITQDEARNELKYAPAARGAVFFAPANKVPLGSTDES